MALILLFSWSGFAQPNIAGNSSALSNTTDLVFSADTTHVAPPTGVKETDRASILAALEQVQSGDTVQFASGTYLIGEVISLKVPHVTLLGHSEGTTIRGCDPDKLGTREFASMHCNGLELAGVQQTVRGFSFEYAYWALHLGCCWGERAMLRAPDGTLVEGPAIYRTEGGHLVEGNTFRRSTTGIRMNGDWTEPAVVRNNRFVDNWHSVSINRNTVHLLDNDFAVPDPEQVPFYGFPNDAVQVGPTLPLQGVSDTLPRGCADNIIASNRIEGSKNGISIAVYEPGTTCRDNVIRDNTITVRRAKVPAPENFRMIDESDSTFVGTPLSLLNHPEAFGQNETGQESAIAENLIEGNRIIGAEGLGIQVLHASRNRIVNNTVTGIAVRNPFPGNTMGSEPDRWREANGSAIWLSPGSDGNEIAGNTFEDVTGVAVFVEGDSNRVEFRDTNDEVRDMGSGNRVSASAGVNKTESENQDSTLYESKFIEVDGLRLHYLDFGGEGLPVVFVHSEGWDAHTYSDFAPRFTDTNRVIAVTRPGYGESAAHPSGFSVETQAESLIQFLDALGIERAVFAGNSSPIIYLTYIAEHHPDRVAGMVYLAGLMPMWLKDVQESDPTGAGAMVTRARAPNPDALKRSLIIDLYRPQLLNTDSPKIDVPALAFAGRSGLIGYEHSNWPLALVGSPLLRDFNEELPPSPATDYLRRLVDDPAFRDKGLSAIEDSTTRAFLTRLADDPDLQAEVWRYQQETVRPALIEGQEKFLRAFNRIRIVPLDVSTIYGYEYRDNPELIEPHIRRFLEEVMDDFQPRSND